jgi:hypothetical protein
MSNGWHHIAVNFRKTTSGCIATPFIDGVVAADGDIQVCPSAPGFRYRVGGTGIVDELAGWSTTLSVPQIQTLVRETRPY